MKVNGRNVDFKITRIEDAGRYEFALRNMEAKEKEIKEEMKKSKSLSMVLAGINNMFKKFFEDVGCPEVLEDCEDAEEAKKAYIEFLREVKKQKDDILTFSPEDIK